MRYTTDHNAVSRGQIAKIKLIQLRDCPFFLYTAFIMWTNTTQRISEYLKISRTFETKGL